MLILHTAHLYFILCSSFVYFATLYFFWGGSGDRGEAVFKGRIRMPKIAQKSSSAQLCRSLLMGTLARLQAMPVLEITADDITCSHGASVSDLDENSLFYLASRGINRQVRFFKIIFYSICNLFNLKM